jgi:hypothetical protein
MFPTSRSILSPSISPARSLSQGAVEQETALANHLCNARNATCIDQRAMVRVPELGPSGGVDVLSEAIRACGLDTLPGFHHHERSIVSPPRLSKRKAGFMPSTDACPAATPDLDPSSCFRTTRCRITRRSPLVRRPINAARPLAPERKQSPRQPSRRIFSAPHTATKTRPSPQSGRP